MVKRWCIPIEIRPPTANVKKRFWFNDRQNFGVFSGRKYARPVLRPVYDRVAEMYFMIDTGVVVMEDWYDD